MVTKSHEPPSNNWVFGPSGSMVLQWVREDSASEANTTGPYDDDAEDRRAIRMAMVFIRASTQLQNYNS